MAEKECKYCDDDVLFTSEYVCEAHQWVEGSADIAAVGAALGRAEKVWEPIGDPKFCAREGCGGVFYRETTVIYTWEIPWGRRIYRNRYPVNYCSEACRKALARKKAATWRAVNKAMDEKYARCRFSKVCGNWVIGKRPDAKFCSDACRKRWWNTKKRWVRKKKKDQG